MQVPIFNELSIKLSTFIITEKTSLKVKAGRKIWRIPHGILCISEASLVLGVCIRRSLTKTGEG